MLPYFRSAGCHNYARYGAFYIHHMKGLPPETMKKLQHGAFVRHIPGIYNATWTDMFIETTYMRLGHGPAGAVGVATNYNQMVKRALSFALSREVSQNVRAISNTEQDALQNHHKEEADGRIKADRADRLSLRNTLDVHINPLHDVSHPDGALIKIVTDQIAHPDVNADDAVSIGKQAMRDFRDSWPESFYAPLGKLVVTMDVKKKHVLLGNERVYDQELIYARVIGLIVSSRDIKFDDVLEKKVKAPVSSPGNEDTPQPASTEKLNEIVQQSLKDSQRRQKNIIISGLPESRDVSDADALRTICEENLKYKPWFDDTKCKRIGKSSPRRLLVTLPSAVSC